MAPPNLVLLNRRFDDRATPTASTFSVRGNTSTAHDHGEANETNEAPSHGFTDYDEGDILDELLQETPRTSAPPSRIATVTALSTDALRSRVSPASTPLPSPVCAVDDNASTCSSSSTTAAEDEVDFDREDNHDDTASITSMSVSGQSVSTSSGSSSCIAPSSTASPKLPPAAVTQMPGVGGRRRRRRNNRGGNGIPNNINAAASDAGSESVNVAEKKGQPKRACATATAQAPSAAPATTTKPSKRERSKKTKSKSALVTAARQSRHPRLQIGLDLDVELQLKSKVRGDICLTLVLEETQKVAPRSSPEIRRNADGNYVAYDDWEDVQVDVDDEKEERKKKKLAKPDDHDADTETETEEIEVTRVVRSKKGGKPQSVQPRPGALGTERRELCHLRVGRLNLTRRWWMDGYEMISRIPPPIVAGVAMTMPVAGFAAGYAVANWAGLW